MFAISSLRRRACAAMLLVGWWTPVCYAQTPAGVKQPPKFAEHVQQALDRKLDWDFVERPLSDVVIWLSSETGVPFTLATKKLDEVGVLSDTPITLELHDVSLRSALNLCLKELELTWRLGPGTVVITTPEDAERNLEPRVYPVRDLVQVQTKEGISYDVDSLIDLITMIVAPQSWDTVGGPGPITEVEGHTLIVPQTQDVHEQIELLLRLYRQLRKDHATNTKQVAKPWYGEEVTAATWKKLRSVESRQVDWPLRDIVHLWSEVTKVPFWINVKKLDEVGARPDTHVTGEYHESPVFDGIRECLRPLDLAITIEGDVAVITTPEDAESKLQLRVYPVYDIVKPKPKPKRGFFDFGQIAPEEALADAIQHVAQESWSSWGGNCSMDAVSNPPALFVSATLDVHQRVEKVIADLRANRPDEEEVKPDPEACERRVLFLRPIDGAVGFGGIGGGFGGGGTPSAATENSPAPNAKGDGEKSVAQPRARIPDAAEVAKLIRKYVQSDSWDHADTALDVFENRIILTNRRRTLDAAEDFLHEMKIWYTR